MAIDIQVAVSGTTDVKNGTCVVSCTRTGEYSTIDTFTINSPTMTSIESKFDNRFDDPSYYYGCNTDGGNV
jgi:hypothetical protein